MNRFSFTFARFVLALFATSIAVACSGGAASEDADVVNDIGATASQPAAPTDAPAPSVAPAGLPAGAELPAGVTEEMIHEGQEIYAGAGICAACHGPNGEGAIGPDLTDGEWLIGDGEYEQLVRQITEGVDADDATNPLGAIMPPKGGAAITESQVRSVAAYVWALSQ